MATYYARAGGGNWSAAATWSLTSGGGATGSTPTAADDLRMDAASGAVTIDGTSGSPSLCRSLDCTGYTGTLTAGATAVLNIGDASGGSLTLVSGMTFAPNAASLINLVSTTTGNNITTGGKTLGNLTFNGVGGGWTFQSNVTLANASTITLTNGSLNTNSLTVTARFSSNNSNVRSLTLGTTTWTLPSQAATTWDITDSTNLTYSGASATIINALTTSGGNQFMGGGLTYNSYTVTNITTGNHTITGANTFGTLSIGSGSGITARVELASSQTVTGTLTLSGNSAVNRIYIRSNTRGTLRALTASTVTASNVDLQDIAGLGAASWNLSAITGGSGDCGGNSGITFTTPATQYWVPSGGTSTGSMSAATRWASSSGGTAGTGRSPLPQDTARFDANSIDAGSRVITQDKPRLSAVDWTGVTNTPDWAMSTACLFLGSITTVAGMTQSGTNAYTYEGRGTATFTSGGQTFGRALIIDCVGGTLVQGGNWTTGGNFTMTSGNFSGATYTISSAVVNINGGSATFYQPTFSGTTTSGAGDLTIGAGGATFAALTKNSTGSLTINGNSTASGAISLQGGAVTLNADLTGASTLSNTGSSVTIAAGKRLTFNNGYYGAAAASASGGGSYLRRR